MNLRKAIGLFFNVASLTTGLPFEVGDFHERQRGITPNLDPRTIKIERTASGHDYVVVSSRTLPVTGEMRLVADTLRMWMTTDVLSDLDTDEIKVLDDEAILALPVVTNETGSFDIIMDLEYFRNGTEARVIGISMGMTVLPDGTIERR